MIKNVKYTLFLSEFNETWIYFNDLEFFVILSENTQISTIYTYNGPTNALARNKTLIQMSH
jgi:hypothetical protein